MYYGRRGLGFSLKPPSWAIKTIQDIFRKGTAGGVNVPLPGGGTASFPGPAPDQAGIGMPDTNTTMLLIGAAAIGAILLLGRRR